MNAPSETRAWGADVQFATKRGARCELEIRGPPPGSRAAQSYDAAQRQLQGLQSRPERTK